MSPTSITLDTADPTPPFEQVRRQVAALISSGALEEGSRLPTVRQLAGDLRVAPGTVARAYKELESAGLVVTRRGAGTCVASGRTLPPERRRERLEELARQYVTAARRLGADDAALRGAVETAL
ncbi:MULTISPECIES: GntR family transcriptional regulator [unclassified Actinomyces]|uniref:GntR family transcriptional regulator n=1 Tax=unclassified Actinomyces TaxID=2609248 RepID=UPI002018238F|nr:MULTISPECIES: GntR family transcriptional regulator [unclassified Actinomyces]MCL3778487.1 GntR family transcriptional regulator [Actinomyces sp. AC-20-1]MCL3789689.1 GntR family transcriptional regulator [Actinomyces sp. 187325]MCL3792831.1 GntR family transcriptional regulator [Actinomyces sp. 186855]MCL3795397.1 GntR family transcriptional regulator [Actinomyces sp. 217892]